MIYWHQALLTARRLDNCTNVKAVYRQSPRLILGSIYRDPLWTWNTAQWVWGGRLEGYKNKCMQGVLNPSLFPVHQPQRLPSLSIIITWSLCELTQCTLCNSYMLQSRTTCCFPNPPSLGFLQMIVLLLPIRQCPSSELQDTVSQHGFPRTCTQAWTPLLQMLAGRKAAGFRSLCHLFPGRLYMRTSRDSHVKHPRASSPLNYSSTRL